MPWEVTLTDGDREERVIVEAVKLGGGVVRLYGFDPSFCPDGFEEGIIFSSSDLYGWFTIDNSAGIKLVSVEHTTEAVPEPEVAF